MLIAFDQALNTTGYAVFNRKDGSLVAYDKFTTESVDEEYKLREIRDKVLELIDMVGNNLSLGQGMCGAESGSIPANVGQPTIRIKSLTVGGRKGEE